MLLLIAACHSPEPDVPPDPAIPPLSTSSPVTATRAVTPTLRAGVVDTPSVAATPQPPAPPSASQGNTATLTLRDIPTYPGAQPVPPDKNPTTATLLESIRNQVAADARLESEVFMLVGAEVNDRARDVELFYITELTELTAWQRSSTINYDIALPEVEDGKIATAMSWHSDNQIFTFVLVERYGQYVLMTLLQTNSDSA